MLILLSKIFLEFILESPTFLRGSRNHCEAILPGKMMIFDSRYSVLVWELVSYWPVFPYFSFEACIFFTFQFPFFLYLGWYVWQCRSNQQYYNCLECYGLCSYNKLSFCTLHAIFFFFSLLPKIINRGKSKIAEIETVEIEECL